jgi:hypothetical protein
MFIDSSSVLCGYGGRAIEAEAARKIQKGYMELVQPWHLVLLLIVLGVFVGIAIAVIRLLNALARKAERS